MSVRVKYLSHHEGLPPLERMTSGSSGFDIRAACSEEIVIEPGSRALVPSGFILSIPEGFEGQIRPRSGLAANEGISVLNSPGTIDSDYRGEVKVILHNWGSKRVVVRRGDRIAQIVFIRLPSIEIVEDASLDETDRGSGGFGHTGK